MPTEYAVTETVIYVRGLTTAQFREMELLTGQDGRERYREDGGLCAFTVADRDDLPYALGYLRGLNITHSVEETKRWGG